MTHKLSVSIRSIAWLLIILFSVEQVGHAAPMPFGRGPATAVTSGASASLVTLKQVIHDPSKLDIPFEHVTVQEVHQGANGKLIIHIQDAHANYSGQKSLASALDHFMTQYDLALVLAEGGSKDASLGAVRGQMSQRDLKVAANQLLFEGLIAGHEYLNLTSEHDMQLIGIESAELYEQNLSDYAQLTTKRQEILTYLHRTQSSLDRIKNKLYPKELLELESQEKMSRIGALNENFSQLFALAQKQSLDLEATPELTKLSKLQAFEASIDYNRATLEQTVLFERLQQRGIQDLILEHQKTQGRLKHSQISQAIFIEKLFTLALEKGLAPERYIEFSKYHNYLKQFSELNFSQVFDELDILREKVYTKILASEDARILRAIDRYVGLLRQAYQIKMSSQQFKRYRVNKPEFQIDAWQGFLNEQLVKLGYYQDLIPYQPNLEQVQPFLEDFYGVVDKRDLAFMRNTARILDKEEKDVAFIVAGGYHTAHLTQLLRKENYSYIVLAPVVTTETDQQKYEDLLLAPIKQAKLEAVRRDKQLASLQPERVRTLVAHLSAEKGAQARFTAHQNQLVLTGSRNHKSATKLIDLIHETQVASGARYSEQEVEQMIAEGFRRYVAELPAESTDTETATDSLFDEARGIRVKELVFSIPYLLITSGMMTYQLHLVESLLRTNHDLTMHLTYANYGDTPSIFTIEDPVRKNKVIMHGLPLDVDYGAEKESQYGAGLVERLASLRRQGHDIDLIVNNIPEHLGSSLFLLLFAEEFGIPTVAYALGGYVMDEEIMQGMARHTRAATDSDYMAHALSAIPGIQGIPPITDISSFYAESLTEADRQAIQDLKQEHEINGHPVIVHVGRVAREKGHELGIRALSELKQLEPNLNARLVIVGPDQMFEEEHLRDLVASLGLQDDVIFTGELTPDQVRHWYAVARENGVAIYPSIWQEPYGIVPVEAQAAGVPIIAGRNGGLVETMIDQETGMLVDTDDHSELTTAIQYLLTHPEERRRMGAAGIEFVKERFTDHHLRYTQLYLDAIAAHGESGQVQATHDPIKSGARYSPRTLSIVMPSYNRAPGEVEIMLRVLDQVVAVDIGPGEKEVTIAGETFTVDLGEGITKKEIHIVLDQPDDFEMQDGRTIREVKPSILQKVADINAQHDDVQVIVHQHEVNRGKGAGIRTAIDAASGEYFIVQDDDGEYDPKDYPALLAPMLSGKADVVYGKRQNKNTKKTYSLLYFGSWLVTFVRNLLYWGAKVGDDATGYKLYRTEIIKPMILIGDRFSLEPELTSKVLKWGYGITNVPIEPYEPRSKEEGKNITAWDGVKWALTIVKYRFVTRRSYINPNQPIWDYWDSETVQSWTYDQVMHELRRLLSRAYWERKPYSFLTQDQQMDHMIHAVDLAKERSDSADIERELDALLRDFNVALHPRVHDVIITVAGARAPTDSDLIRMFAQNDFRRLDEYLNEELRTADEMVDFVISRAGKSSALGLAVSYVTGQININGLPRAQKLMRILNRANDAARFYPVDEDKGTDPRKIRQKLSELIGRIHQAVELVKSGSRVTLPMMQSAIELQQSGRDEATVVINGIEHFPLPSKLFPKKLGINSLDTPMLVGDFGVIPDTSDQKLFATISNIYGAYMVDTKKHPKAKLFDAGYMSCCGIGIEATNLETGHRAIGHSHTLQLTFADVYGASSDLYEVLTDIHKLIKDKYEPHTYVISYVPAQYHVNMEGRTIEEYESYVRQRFHEAFDSSENIKIAFMPRPSANVGTLDVLADGKIIMQIDQQIPGDLYDMLRKAQASVANRSDVDRFAIRYLSSIYGGVIRNNKSDQASYERSVIDRFRAEFPESKVEIDIEEYSETQPSAAIVVDQVGVSVLHNNELKQVDWPSHSEPSGSRGDIDRKRYGIERLKEWKSHLADLSPSDDDIAERLPQLIQEARSQHPDEVVATLTWLNNFGSSAAPAIPWLAELVRTNRERTSRESVKTGILRRAVIVLGNIGPAAQDQVGLLESLSDDRNFGVKNEAQIALGKIQGARTGDSAVSLFRRLLLYSTIPFAALTFVASTAIMTIVGWVLLQNPDDLFEIPQFSIALESSLLFLSYVSGKYLYEIFTQWFWPDRTTPRLKATQTSIRQVILYGVLISFGVYLISIYMEAAPTDTAPFSKRIDYYEDHRAIKHTIESFLKVVGMGDAPWAEPLRNTWSEDVSLRQIYGDALSAQAEDVNLEEVRAKLEALNAKHIAGARDTKTQEPDVDREHPIFGVVPEDTGVLVLKGIPGDRILVGQYTIYVKQIRRLNQEGEDRERRLIYKVTRSTTGQKERNVVKGELEPGVSQAITKDRRIEFTWADEGEGNQGQIVIKAPREVKISRFDATEELSSGSRIQLARMIFAISYTFESVEHYLSENVNWIETLELARAIGITLQESYLFVNEDDSEASQVILSLVEARTELITLLGHVQNHLQRTVRDQDRTLEEARTVIGETLASLDRAIAYIDDDYSTSPHETLEMDVLHAFDEARELAYRVDHIIDPQRHDQYQDYRAEALQLLLAYSGEVIETEGDEFGLAEVPVLNTFDRLRGKLEGLVAQYESFMDKHGDSHFETEGLFNEVRDSISRISEAIDRLNDTRGSRANDKPSQDGVGARSEIQDPDEQLGLLQGLHQEMLTLGMGGITHFEVTDSRFYEIRNSYGGVYRIELPEDDVNGPILPSFEYRYSHDANIGFFSITEFKAGHDPDRDGELPELVRVAWQVVNAIKSQLPFDETDEVGARRALYDFGLGAPLGARSRPIALSSIRGSLYGAIESFVGVDPLREYEGIPPDAYLYINGVEVRRKARRKSDIAVVHTQTETSLQGRLVSVSKSDRAKIYVIFLRMLQRALKHRNDQNIDIRSELQDAHVVFEVINQSTLSLDQDPDWERERKLGVKKWNYRSQFERLVEEANGEYSISQNDTSTTQALRLPIQGVAGSRMPRSEAAGLVRQRSVADADDRPSQAGVGSRVLNDETIQAVLGLIGRAEVKQLISTVGTIFQQATDENGMDDYLSLLPDMAYDYLYQLAAQSVFEANVNRRQVVSLIQVLSLYGISHAGAYDEIHRYLGNSNPEVRKVLLTRVYAFAFTAWMNDLAMVSDRTRDHREAALELLNRLAEVISPEFQQANIAERFIQIWDQRAVLAAKDRFINELNSEYLFDAGIAIKYGQSVSPEDTSDVYPDVSGVYLIDNPRDLVVRDYGSFQVRRLQGRKILGKMTMASKAGTALSPSNITILDKQVVRMQAKTWFGLHQRYVSERNHPSYQQIPTNIRRYIRLLHQAINQDLPRATDDTLYEINIRQVDDHESEHVYDEQVGDAQETEALGLDEVVPILGQIASGETAFLSLASTAELGVSPEAEMESQQFSRRDYLDNLKLTVRALDILYNAARERSDQSGFRSFAALPELSSVSELESNLNGLPKIVLDEFEALLKLNKEVLIALADEVYQERLNRRPLARLESTDTYPLEALLANAGSRKPRSEAAGLVRQRSVADADDKPSQAGVGSRVYLVELLNQMKLTLRDSIAAIHMKGPVPGTFKKAEQPLFRAFNIRDAITEKLINDENLNLSALSTDLDNMRDNIDQIISIIDDILGGELSSDHQTELSKIRDRMTRALEHVEDFRRRMVHLDDGVGVALNRPLIQAYDDMHELMWHLSQDTSIGRQIDEWTERAGGEAGLSSTDDDPEYDESQYIEMYMAIVTSLSELFSDSVLTPSRETFIEAKRVIREDLLDHLNGLSQDRQLSNRAWNTLPRIEDNLNTMSQALDAIIEHLGSRADDKLLPQGARLPELVVRGARSLVKQSQDFFAGVAAHAAEGNYSVAAGPQVARVQVTAQKSLNVWNGQAYVEVLGARTTKSISPTGAISAIDEADLEALVDDMQYQQADQEAHRIYKELVEISLHGGEIGNVTVLLKDLVGDETLGVNDPTFKANIHMLAHGVLRLLVKVGGTLYVEGPEDLVQYAVEQGLVEYPGADLAEGRTTMLGHRDSIAFRGLREREGSFLISLQRPEALRRLSQEVFAAALQTTVETVEGVGSRIVHLIARTKGLLQPQDKEKIRVILFRLATGEHGAVFLAEADTYIALPFITNLRIGDILEATQKLISRMNTWA